MMFRTAAPVVPDLSVCDREPIHIPGSIQPHGKLLALSGPERRIAHASANVADIVGKPVGQLLGATLAEVMPDVAAAVAGALDDLSTNQETRHIGSMTLTTAHGPSKVDAVAHRSGEYLILELEDGLPDEDRNLDTLYLTLRGFVERLQVAANLADLCTLAAVDIRRLTGFDRVLIYRFDESWNGSVVAEDRNENLPSYLGLRFPASDIPAQARELYRRNRLRLIPDAGYRPIPIEVAAEDAAGGPIDLGLSVLRSVSPVHLEYMRNMGTGASMSISILRDGALWGLISCHNATPRRVSLRVRNACDFLTQILALQIAARERAEDAEQRMRLGAIQARLLAFMAEKDHFLDGMIHHPAEMLALTNAGGAAIVSSDHCWRLGRTPSEEQVRELFAWLSGNHREDVFATDELAAHFPGASAYTEEASGLLAISISKMMPHYVLWFRPEVVRTVSWGGEPGKVLPSPGSQDGVPERLHPRKSFEIWKETVRRRSLPWQASEIDIVKELRNAVVGIVLRRAEELAALSEELQRSNKELEAFSYSVSHDLRAPFRHIIGYSELLRNDRSSTLSERGRRYVDTIIESAYMAGTLVDNLLSFSQMGRAALKPRTVDMSLLVEEVRQRLSMETRDRRIVWDVGDLATVRADPMMMRLVVENLLSNAVKYTRRRDEARIAVTCRREGSEVVFSVRDNGVGFDMGYVGKLFGVFQRLHRMEEFEGTGIGLANVRRIVERHGGRVWAEGTLDQGATFHFALPATIDMGPPAVPHAARGDA